MKRRIIIDVDSGELFDRLRDMGGSTLGIGDRLVEVLMTGEASLTTAIGLRFYGIDVAASQIIAAAPTEAGGDGEGDGHAG